MGTPAPARSALSTWTHHNLASDAEVERLAAILVGQGHSDERAVERGRRVAADSGQRLDAVLVQLGLVTERGLAEGFAALLDLPIARPERYPADAPLLPGRPGAKFLRHARAMPVAVEGDLLTIAIADPLDRFVPAAIAAATGRRIALEVALPIELDAAFERLYVERDEIADDFDRAAAVPEEPLEQDAEPLKDLASEAPVIRLVNQIIARAVETRASDIHLEPFEDRLRVRYRYDGVLHEVEAPPPRLTAAITSRVKIMARLDIAERRLPQNGRIKLAVRGTEIDFRVSTIPSLHGETVVLRVLDRSAVSFDYAQLGLPDAVVARWNAALALPNGIVLVTGPTGSGKTTTLYTGLLALNSVARKIVTIEDPIEYQLGGINQIQVKPPIGLDFASLLRSILRQDPDVIMVAEIRDLETAQIAVQAALTGHLALSTLHTNSAAATITRLRDMGVEDYLLTAVLRGILAQRLVRRLCPHCRRAAASAAELIRRFDLERRCRGATMKIWHPVGCEQCRNTGYRGRQAIAEFLAPDAAVAAGMATMLDAGLDAALAGTTTIEEVVRSVRSEG